MADFPSRVRHFVTLRGLLEHTSSTARVLDDGRLELEYYDFSPAAHAHLGNDVAWIYRLDSSQKPRLSVLLGARTGSAIPDDQSILDALAQSFADTPQVKAWLLEMKIPFEEEFDSWA